MLLPPPTVIKGGALMAGGSLHRYLRLCFFALSSSRHDHPNHWLKFKLSVRR